MRTVLLYSAVCVSSRCSRGSEFLLLIPEWSSAPGLAVQVVAQSFQPSVEVSSVVTDLKIPQEEGNLPAPCRYPDSGKRLGTSS